MKLVGLNRTAVLSMTLGAVAPAYAQQEQRDQKEEPEAKPEEQKAKPAQEEKKSGPGEVRKTRGKNRSERRKKTPSRKRRMHNRKKRITDRKKRTRSSNAQSRLRPCNRRNAAVVDGFLTDRFKANFETTTGFVSTKPTIEIIASNTAAIRLDSLIPGPATGSTRKTFM